MGEIIPLRSREADAPLVWFASDVITEMEVEAARTFPRETGGVLMGYVGANSSDIVVRACIGPGPGAVHRKASFVPDHQYHEREVARVYSESGRIWTYLGDWHSHPDGRLYLSSDDRRTILRIARATEARAANPIMTVIAGGRAREESGRHAVGSINAADELRWHAWKIGTWRHTEAPSRWSCLGMRPPVTRCTLLVLETCSPDVE